MTTIKATTNKGQAFLGAYRLSNDYTLYDVYTTCSRKKLLAYDACIARMQNMNGNGFKILSANTFTFTCAYRVENNLIVETAQNTYCIVDAFKE